MEGTAEMAVAGIQKRVPASADQLRLLRQAVAQFAADECGNAAQMHDSLMLAVTEACTNVILHAYGAGELDRQIDLRAWVDRRHLQVEIRDQGVGVDRSSPSPGLGLGLALMRAVADARITFSAGTTVNMRFPREPLPAIG
jgi:anti-sigma regulatory factor (Ser/Thr protein kinase)